jgi:hypothetical protein
MSIYTVHARATAEQPHPDQFVFIRDGFSFWAFLLAPLWILRYRLWLVLVLYVSVVIALEAALYLLDASLATRIAAGLLLSLLVGFEAATLRRFTLARRGWSHIGIVVADDLEAAERRFFDVWANGETPLISPAAAGVPRIRPAPPSEIIGLFPQAGGSR